MNEQPGARKMIRCPDCGGSGTRWQGEVLRSICPGCGGFGSRALSEVEKLREEIGRLTGEVERRTGAVERLTGEVERLTGEVERLTGGADPVKEANFQLSADFETNLRASLEGRIAKAVEEERAACAAIADQEASQAALFVARFLQGKWNAEVQTRRGTAASIALRIRARGEGK